MHEQVSDSLYVDYCHLLPEGHTLLTKRLVEVIKKYKLGTTKAQLINKLTNPELGMGNFSTFFDYLNNRETSRESKVTKSTLQLDDLNLDTSFIQNLLKHPIFPSSKEVLKIKRVSKYEMGRFPEFLILRHISPYVKIALKDPKFIAAFKPISQLLHSYTDYLSILPEDLKSLFENQKLFHLSLNDPSYAERVMRRVRNDLLTHLNQGCQVENRLKTTIYWYFRESMRYGYHSRFSMRFDLITLEYLAEALLVVHIVQPLKTSSVKGQALIKILGETYNVHMKYAPKYSPNSNYDRLHIQYTAELGMLAQTLKKI